MEDPDYLSRVPESVPFGKVVVHNRVPPARRLGSRGFRAWLAEPSSEYEICPCEWAPELGAHASRRLAPSSSWPTSGAVGDGEVDEDGLNAGMARSGCPQPPLPTGQTKKHRREAPPHKAGFSLSRLSTGYRVILASQSGYRASYR